MLFASFPDSQPLRGSKSIKTFFVNGVKVDLVNYPYPWLDPVLEIENIQMASVRDIAAMKIAAITQRGSKKDFIDLYYLLQRFSLKEIMRFYKTKMTDSNEWLALRSVTYFDDADHQPAPVIFESVDWMDIKYHIIEEAKKYS